MSDGFEKLKEIGAQKIHEKTHITREHIQAILHDSFEGMNKIQFLGFISILERDYGVKLNDLKIRGLDYFLNITSKTNQNTSVFIETKKKSSNAPYIIVALLLVAALFFILNKTFFTDGAQKSQEIDTKIDVKSVENIKSDLLNDSNIMVETNTSLADENSSISDESYAEDENSAHQKELSVDKQIEPEASAIVNSFKILPNKKLWMSYTDLKEDKTNEKIFSAELSLDTSKDWLLNLGHGNVNIEINGKILEYNLVRNLKFLYKDGNLTEIDVRKFNAIKKDHKW